MQLKREEPRTRSDGPEGSFEARSFGNAVHAFLEMAARRLAEGAEPDDLAAEVPRWKERAFAVLRGDGLPPQVVERLGARVIVALTNTLRDRVGRWLLSAHTGARSEYALTSWNEDWSRVRMDRTFRAGASPTAQVPSTCGSWITRPDPMRPEVWTRFCAAEKSKYARTDGAIWGRYGRAEGQAWSVVSDGEPAGVVDCCGDVRPRTLSRISGVRGRRCSMRLWAMDRRRYCGGRRRRGPRR